MTDDTETTRHHGPEESRRGLLRKGALATGSAVLGLSITGSAAAQEDDADAFRNEERFRCVLFQEDFRPGSEFVITSPVLDWTPPVPVDLGTPFEGYNTRMIRYLGTGDNTVFFPSQDARIPGFDREAGYVVDDDENFGEDEFAQPEVFALRNEASFHEGTTRLVTGLFSSVEEDREDTIWDGEDFRGETDWIV